MRATQRPQRIVPQCYLSADQRRSTSPNDGRCPHRNTPSSSTLRYSTTGRGGTHHSACSRPSSTRSATPPPPETKQPDRAKHRARQSLRNTRGGSPTRRAGRPRTSSPPARCRAVRYRSPTPSACSSRCRSASRPSEQKPPIPPRSRPRCETSSIFAPESSSSVQLRRCARLAWISGSHVVRTGDFLAHSGSKLA